MTHLRASETNWDAIDEGNIGVITVITAAGSINGGDTAVGAIAVNGANRGGGDGSIGSAVDGGDTALGEVAVDWPDGTAISIGWEINWTNVDDG